MSKSKSFKQRWVPLALVPLFSVSVLAGCGSDDDDGGGETDGEMMVDPGDMMVVDPGDMMVVDPNVVVGDSDGNGIPNAFETLDATADADGNGIIDTFQTAADGTTTDANENGVDDSFEVALTGGADSNGDGVDDAADPNFTPTPTGGDGELTTADQVGPLEIPLSDAGNAALNWDGSNLTGQINVEGLPDGVGPARAALFTGIAAAGSGAELVQFNGDGNPTYFLPTPLAADQQAAVTENIQSGNLYVQVELSDGSSRNGIILIPGVDPKFADLQAANAVPAGDAFTNGAGFLNRDSVTGAFSAVVNINLNASDLDADGNSETVSAVHIHQGAEGMEGPVLVALEDAGNGSMWTAQGTFTAEQLELVLDGNTYFNVHRTNGDNFIRGQIPQ